MVGRRRHGRAQRMRAQRSTLAYTCERPVTHGRQAPPHVDDADQAEELEQRILQRRGRKKDLGGVGQRQLERVGDDVRGLVDVAQPVGFFHHHDVPGRLMNVRGFVPGELIGADDDLPVGLKRPESAGLDRLVVGLGLENPARQKELVRQLLVPLLAKVRRRNDEDAPFAFRPLLSHHQTGFDRLPKANLIGQQETLRKRRPEGEQGGGDLMGIQVYRCVSPRSRSATTGARLGSMRGIVQDLGQEQFGRF
jgi:hypothetical protein